QVEEQIAQAFHLSEQQRSGFIENGTLETNYRSLPNIIAFNNYLFSHIPQKLQHLLNETIRQELDEEGQAWWNSSGNDGMLTKAYTNSQQAVPAKLQDHPLQKGSIEIQYLPVENGRFRRNQVIEEALQLLCDKISTWITSGRYKPQQIGILVRSNAQARQVIEALMRHKHDMGLDHEVISGDALSLESNDAILLLVETLRALVYNSERHILYRAKMAYLYQSIRQEVPFEPEFWLTFKSNNIHDLEAILPRDLLTQWTHLQQAPLIHLIERLIEIYGLHEKDSPHIPYLLTFKDIVSGFSTNG